MNIYSNGSMIGDPTFKLVFMIIFAIGVLIILFTIFYIFKRTKFLGRYRKCRQGDSLEEIKKKMKMRPYDEGYSKGGIYKLSYMIKKGFDGDYEEIIFYFNSDLECVDSLHNYKRTRRR